MGRGGAAGFTGALAGVQVQAALASGHMSMGFPCPAVLRIN